MTTTETARPEYRDIVIERIFDAPRELVWRAWTEPEHFKRWWGPKDFTAPDATLDLREGGRYLASMQSPDGQKFWSGGFYNEIVPLQKIVYTDSFTDEAGNVVPASHYGMEGDLPLEFHVTLTFEELEGNKTKLTLRHVGIPVGEMSDMTEAGWNESLDKLAEVLAR
jgi:uncharacterized protein YndB with AHSA1/START domain